MFIADDNIKGFRLFRQLVFPVMPYLLSRRMHKRYLVASHYRRPTMR